MYETIDPSKVVTPSESERFPNVVITEPNETLPVVVRNLEKGDMQLIVLYNGMRKAVCTISPSAYNISKLLRTTSNLQYNKSPGDSTVLHTISDYISCCM